MVVIAKPPDVLVPSERTPGQFAGPGIAGGIGQAGVALGRSVQALARPLIGWAEQIAQVQDAGDEAKFLGIVNTEREAMRIFMEANPSLYSEFEAKWGEAEVRIQKASESVMRRRVQDRLQDYIKKNSPIWKATVTKNIQDGIVLQTKVDALDTIDKTVIGDFRDDAKAASNIEDGIIVEEKELKLAKIKELIDNANVNGMLWNPLEVRVIMNNAEKAIDIYEKERLKDDVWKQATAFVRPDGEVDWAKTVGWFNQPENIRGLPEDIIEDLASTARAQSSSQARNDSAKLQMMQEKTNKMMLSDYWEGKLKDPQIVTDAFQAGFLDETDAKYLRKAILNPELPKLNLQSLAIVKQAIEEIGTNTKTVPQALSVLYAHLDSIDPTTGKSLVTEIFSEQDRNKSEMKRESRSLMEELIRDRDKFTGMFTDDERQILASAEAYLMLDTEIQKAVETDKPLERRDIMIKAIQIGRQMKKKIKQEEADKVPPGFEPETEGFPTVPRAPDYTAKGKPITKGALAKPDFALDSEGEPEKVFDSEGREVGLRRKSGAVFEIGYVAIFAGKKYEYTGNGNWKLVK